MGFLKTVRLLRLGCVFSFLGLAGCANLPSAGPSAQDVVQQAGYGEPENVRYEFVDIDPSVIEAVRRRAPNSFAARFGDRRIAAEPVIGVGDTVSVTIWEAASGGLFSSSTSTSS